MVAIDRYADVSESPPFGRLLKGFWRGVLRDLAYPVIVYRQLRGLEIVEQPPIRFAKASFPTVAETSGPVLLTAAETVASLQKKTAHAVSIADSVGQVHNDANSGLDWVAYELAAIRRDIADNRLTSRCAETSPTSDRTAETHPI